MATTEKKFGPEVAQGYIDQIHDDATPSGQLQQLATEINGKLEKFSIADQNELAEALKHKLGTNNLRNYITEQKLNGLNSLLLRLEQAGETGAPGPTGETGAKGRAGSTEKAKIETTINPAPKPTYAPEVAPPQKPALEPSKADSEEEDGFAKSAGTTVEKGLTVAAGALGVATEKTIGFVGDSAKGYLGIVDHSKNILEREKQFWSQSSTPDKILRYTGVAGAIILACKLSNWIIRGKKGADGKRKSSTFRKVLGFFGITAFAGWALNKLGPLAERQRILAGGAPEAPRGAHAPTASLAPRSTSVAPAVKATPTTDTILTPETKKIADQIGKGTDLMANTNEINLNGEKIKFQITEKGLILNDHIYTANIKAPGHWSAKDETLYPKITKAIWGENGIDVEEEITFTKKDGETSINKKKATIKFDEIPAFFDQAKTGKSFVFKYNFLLFLYKDINFEKATS